MKKFWLGGIKKNDMNKSHLEYHMLLFVFMAIKVKFVIYLLTYFYQSVYLFILSCMCVLISRCTYLYVQVVFMNSWNWRLVM